MWNSIKGQRSSTATKSTCSSIKGQRSSTTTKSTCNSIKGQRSSTTTKSMCNSIKGQRSSTTTKSTCNSIYITSAEHQCPFCFIVITRCIVLHGVMMWMSILGCWPSSRTILRLCMYTIWCVLCGYASCVQGVTLWRQIRWHLLFLLYIINKPKYPCCCCFLCRHAEHWWWYWPMLPESYTINATLAKWQLVSSLYLHFFAC